MTTQPTIRILIIDDDDDDRAILGDLLATQGHTAVPASSGAEGLRLARELIPDLIILDVEFLTKPVDIAELRVRVQAIARVNRYRRLLEERARAERSL